MPVPSRVAPANSKHYVHDPLTDIQPEEAKKMCCPGTLWNILMAVVYGYFAFANPDKPAGTCWVLEDQLKCQNSYTEGATNMTQVFNILFLVGFVWSILFIATWRIVIVPSI